ncbi:MAG: diguanylate cyclase [Myxococcales bacterium]
MLAARGAALGAGALRPRDFLARYGGEEFVLVLPATDHAGAERVDARCREALLGAQIPHAESAVSPLVTVSIGIGTRIPSADDLATPFIEQVDRALYRAKEAGRDAVVAASTRAP